MDAFTLLTAVAGLVLLLTGAELLVRGAARLAARVGLSGLIIGLTVVAFATSAPELAVSVEGAYRGKSDLALGNVVGSNIFNILVVLGLAALVVPLAVRRRVVQLEVPLVIGLSIGVLLFGLDGRIGRWEGALLFAALVIYLWFVIRQSGREPSAGAQGASAGDGTEGDASDGAPTEGGRGGLPAQLALVAGGLGMLVLGSHWLVGGAAALARTLGVSDLVVGLTVIAAGTSLPEVATSVVAGLRGHRDIAVGNALGSNLFNLLAVLGLTALVAPDGVAVPAAALRLDLPVMIAVAVLCLPVFFTGREIDRLEGGLFVAGYAAYVTYVVLRALDHDAQHVFGLAALGIAVPVAAIILAAPILRSRRR